MKSIFFFFTLFFSYLVFAQGIEQAKYLLDQVSEEMKSHENIRFDFSYVLENKEQIDKRWEECYSLAGDRYQLNFLDAIQLFDGDKIYTIVPENEEITITYPEDEEDVSVNSSKLLSFMRRAMAMNGILNNV